MRSNILTFFSFTEHIEMNFTWHKAVLTILLTGAALFYFCGAAEIRGEGTESAAPADAAKQEETKPAEKVKESETGEVLDLSEIPDEKLPNWIVDPNLLSDSESDMDPEVIHAHRQMKGPRQLINFILDAAARKDYKAAAMGLDFTKHPELNQVEREDYAFKLAGILYRLDHFSVAAIPERYEKPKCGIWPDRNYKPIILERQKTGTWRIAPETVADIPRLYERIESKPPVFIHKPWMKKLPRWIFTEVGHLTLFQWGKLAVFFLLGWIFYKISPTIISRLTLLSIRIHRNEVYAELLRRALKPLAYFGMLWVCITDFISSRSLRPFWAMSLRFSIRSAPSL